MVGGTGGPAGAAMTMVLKIYNTAFNASRTGYATAQSTILFVLIASISLILNIMMRKKEPIFWVSHLLKGLTDKVKRWRWLDFLTMRSTLICLN